MAVTTHTLTGAVSDLAGDIVEDTWSLRTPLRPRARVETNLPAGEPLVDTSTGGTLMLGTLELELDPADQSFTVALPSTAATSLNWSGLLYRVVVEFPDAGTRTRQSIESPYFDLTADRDLRSAYEAGGDYAPPTAISAALTEMAQLLADAEAARDAAVDISQIELDDDIVEALIKNIGGAGPKTWAALRSYFVSKDTLWLNARDHGVVGDGATDDTVAIQALLDGLTAGQVLYFPTGTYRHSGLLVSGKTRFAILGDGAVFEGTNSSGQMLDFYNCADFTVRGIGSRTSLDISTTGPRGFSVRSCARFAFVNCSATNTRGPSILMQTCTDGRVQGCMFSDSFKDGIHVTGASKRISIVGNTILRSGDDSIAVVSYQSNGDRCEDVTITGNTTLQSASRGIAVVGGRNVAIGDNVIDSPQNAGIYIAYEATYSTYGVDNVTITGNTIRNADTDAAVDHAGILVISSSTTYAIRAVVVSGNTVIDSRSWGIRVGSGSAGVYDVIVANNIVRGTGALNAIDIQQVTGIVVQGNLIDSVGGDGIGFIDTRGVMLCTGNVVINPNTALSGATRCAIRVNTANLTKAIVSGNVTSDPNGNCTIEIDYVSSPNVLAFGNSAGTNTQGFDSTTAPPFIVPASLLLCGAQLTSGLGGGKGVVGIRNANTAPTSNPSSGGVAFVDSGAARWRTSSGTTRTMAGDFQSVSSNYTVLSSDEVILATGGSGGINVTLPAGVKGMRFTIKKIDAGAGAVTVTPTSGTIDGAASKTLTAQYQHVTIVNNGGSTWHVVAS